MNLLHSFNYNNTLKVEFCQDGNYLKIYQLNTKTLKRELVSSGDFTLPNKTYFRKVLRVIHINPRKSLGELFFMGYFYKIESNVLRVVRNKTMNC